MATTDTGDSVQALARAFEEFMRTTQSLEEAHRLLEARAKDLSERLAAKNQELAITNDYLNYILESMSDGVIAIDTDGIITKFNRGASHVLGYTASEAVGRSFEDLFQREFSLYPYGASSMLQAKGGRTLPISERDAPIADRDNVYIGMVKVFQDLTEIEALRQRIRHMDRLAALGEMAATVAHEIRNPLGGIRGFASLLQRDIDPGDPRARLVEKILVGVRNLDKVVNELLEFTRPVDLNIKPINCAELVDAALSYLDVDDRIRTHNDVPPDLEIKVDADRLRQVLLNMLLNAMQSMDSTGEITISASLDDSMVSVAIADTGCGIAPEHMGKIFSPFFTTKEKGSGLGLAVAAKIIEAHGGAIAAESDLGKGTVFYLRLPREKISEI